MSEKGFFDESRDQSKVKAAIVAKYFDAWANVMVATQDRYNHEKKIAYIDLFAGPGRYEDGTQSTPLLVLQKAIEKPNIRERLVTLFNDKDENNTKSLRRAISALPGIDELKYKPDVRTNEVGEEIVKMFEEMRLVPTLFFVDPWGYKGLSLRLVNSVIKDWGCDCIFFFNYNRINMGLGNPIVKEHMDCLFREDRADDLRSRLEDARDSHVRELLIVEELCQALKGLGPPYVLPFRFRNSEGSRTSHHLIFVSKGFKGYEIMKDIMARESSSQEQNVPSFDYNPVDARRRHRMPLLFQLSRPLDDLAEMLLENFAGRRLTMRDIYKEHSVGRQYVKANYKQVLIKLETVGKIAASKHRENTFGDDVRVTFPPRR